MQVIEPSFEILNPRDLIEGFEKLRFIESMARISHRSEELQTDNSYDRFIRFVVMQKGDWSVVEHAYSTVRLRVDRGVTHELVRHRLFSFTQESTRFVNYQKKGLMEFIRPDGLDEYQGMVWRAQMIQAEEKYMQMIQHGGTPQQARSLLPNALASTIAVTGNLRNWRHFLIMRTTQETHPDFRRVTIPLLAELQKRIPILFDDIVPNQKQSEALSKPR
jgi:thymidylate synthase (FAD)